MMRVTSETVGEKHIVLGFFTNETCHFLPRQKGMCQHPCERWSLQWILVQHLREQITRQLVRNISKLVRFQLRAPFSQSKQIVHTLAHADQIVILSTLKQRFHIVCAHLIQYTTQRPYIKRRMCRQQLVTRFTLGHCHNRTHKGRIRLFVNINGFWRYIGTARLVTHRLLANLTCCIEINQLPLASSAYYVQRLQIRMQYPSVMHMFDAVYQLHKYMSHFFHIFARPTLLLECHEQITVGQGHHQQIEFLCIGFGQLTRHINLNIYNFIRPAIQR